MLGMICIILYVLLIALHISVCIVVYKVRELVLYQRREAQSLKIEILLAGLEMARKYRDKVDEDERE